MQAAASARSALEGDIRLGIERNEFLLHYQPVVNAAGHRMGVETLVRWHHPSAAWCRRANSFRWPNKRA